MGLTTPSAKLSLDPTLVPLVRLAAVVAAGSEEQMRSAAAACVDASVPVTWVEELLLQSYLVCGFPRTLNAMREWRRASGIEAPVDRGGIEPDHEGWRAQGEATCAIVYGESYEKLRHNIERLHPELDQWMIVEGYGKILSRPGLDLRHRELCIVAACVASVQDRQLHSHLHGALNSGATAGEVTATLDAIEGIVPRDALTRARLLFQRVLGKS
jgi:4-carboxymuconolactone decarboxylase